MEKDCGLLVAIASICSLAQSIAWLGLSIFGSLIYLCVIPVAPYSNESDFFRVTFVKLYFEGPKCVSNGSYLGGFNEDYRNSKKLNLLTPDIVFALIVAKIIFDAAQVIFSIALFKTNKSKNVERLRDLVMQWCILTLISSGLDAFLAAKFLLDVFSLTRYLENEDNGVYSETNTNLRGIQFIPMILGLIFGRIVVFWFWNVTVSAYLILIGICCKDKLSKKEPDSPQELLNSSRQIETFSTEFRRRLSETNRSVRDKSQTDWDVYSMEAITRFDEGPERSFQTYLQKAFAVTPYEKQQVDLYEIKNKESEEQDEEGRDERRKWNNTNAAYEKDEEDSDRSSVIFDFRKSVQNSRPNDATKPAAKKPVGKPVNVPLPPTRSQPQWSSC